MNKQYLKDKINEILKGIDECETSSIDGWWETSQGAEAGAIRLERINSLIDSIDDLEFDINKALSKKYIVRTKSGKIITQLTKFTMKNNQKIMLTGIVDDDYQLTWDKQGRRNPGYNTDLDLELILQ